MRTSPSLDAGDGDGARLPVRRRDSALPPDGDPLLDHLTRRLSGSEHDLRALRDAHVRAGRHRAIVGEAARVLANEPESPLLDVGRLALRELGDWCLVEELAGDHLLRAATSVHEEHQDAIAALTRAVVSPIPAGCALSRALQGGRIERLHACPDTLGDGEGNAERDALRALATGPLLVVPVTIHGRVAAALIFGRPGDADGHDDADEHLAANLAALAALGVSHRRTTAAAVSAARAKTEFLAMMSHELRTPLNAIAGYAQLLEMGFRGPLNDDQRDAVNRIIRGQEHLLELVDGVLTFSRLTSGHLVLDGDSVPAASLMQQASEPLMREFAARGIQFRLVPPPEEVRVHADRERAAQVLRQLLGNAAKFTPKGGDVVLRCDVSDGVVRFTVADTGRGIPPVHHESIFHPFVQVEQGLTRSADGSGLGLAIGRELAERMGGTLTVESAVGAGASFILSLPGEIGASS